MTVWNEVKTIEFMVSTEISEAVETAIKLAKDTGATVKFNFNGVEMSVSQYSDKKDHFEYYHRKLNKSEAKPVQNKKSDIEEVKERLIKIEKTQRKILKTVEDGFYKPSFDRDTIGER